MEFDINSDDGTDETTDPVAPGTSCTCLPPYCYCQALEPAYCYPQ